MNILSTANSRKALTFIKLYPNSTSNNNNNGISSQQLENAQKYVKQTLRSRHWIDYTISSYFPQNIRSPYLAIQLFNMQTTRISDNVREPSLGLGKLQFWRQTINRIYRSEQPPAEPLSISINDACHHHPLTKGYFDRIINARSEQLSVRNVQTLAQMLHLCQSTYSTLIAMNLQLLRIDIQPQYQELITKMGYAIGICSYLRRVPYGLRNYRFLVPQDIMDKYNVQASKIWDRVHGKPSEDFYDAVLQIAAYAKKYLEESVVIYEKLEKENKIHPQAFRAFLKGVEVQKYLNMLQICNFNLFDPQLHKGDPFLAVDLWKAARNKRFYIKGKIQ